MAGSYGIDTSVLVRLVTGEPPTEFTRCMERLNALKEAGLGILVSNQVIGEAYITVQHHYDLTEPEARAALLDIFQTRPSLAAERSRHYCNAPKYLAAPACSTDSSPTATAVSVWTFSLWTEEWPPWPTCTDSRLSERSL